MQETVDYLVILQDWEISPNSLMVLDTKLGEGQFGVVKQGIWIHPETGDSEDVAVKMLKGVEHVVHFVHFFQKLTTITVKY